jgi:tetratricopeptide (TPR) repeat protein
MPFRLSRTAFRRFLAVTACLFLGWAGMLVWKTWLKPWLFPSSPLLTTPQFALRGLDGKANAQPYLPGPSVTPEIALQGLQAKSIYYNGAALPWLAKLRPELVQPEMTVPESPLARAYWQATQSPTLFRQLDRQLRFDTILLLDDPSNYQRLLDHLLAPDVGKRDFKLVYLDHWALVFRRDAGREWQPSDAEPIKQHAASLNSEDRAAFLAKAAAKMLAIRQFDAAKRWLDEAEKIDSNSIDVLAGLALYYTSLSKWPQVLTYSDRALEQNENFIPALQAKISGLRGTKYLIDAYKLSNRLNQLLLAQNPTENPIRLWQHAQVAHEAKEYDAEVTALDRLIELAKIDERPAGDYEFQLGEAHLFLAMTDSKHAPLAVQHLKNALRDPTLPEPKRKFAEERLNTIRERSGLK